MTRDSFKLSAVENLWLLKEDLASAKVVQTLLTIKGFILIEME